MGGVWKAEAPPTPTPPPSSAYGRMTLVVIKDVTVGSVCGVRLSDYALHGIPEHAGKSSEFKPLSSALTQLSQRAL